jgi:hypothetical protein
MTSSVEPKIFEDFLGGAKASCSGFNAKPAEIKAFP